MRVGSWDLGLGTWDLGLGTWDLGLGTWDLGVGTWELGSWELTHIRPFYTIVDHSKPKSTRVMVFPGIPSKYQISG